MKIHIGPYKNYFGPYQLAEALCFWVRKVPDAYGIYRKPNWVHNFGEFLAYGSIKKDEDVKKFNDDREETLIYKFLSWIESKRKRKIKIHIDRYDTWNMESTLALIILPMLKQLKKDTHGAPAVEDSDVPEGVNLRSTEAKPKDDEYDVDENHFKRWEWVLDELIWTFEQFQPDCDWEQQYYTGEHDMLWVKSKEKDANGESFYRMEKGPKDTFKVDHDGMNKHNERINNGLRLFGKYYRNLWD